MFCSTFFLSRALKKLLTSKWQQPKVYILHQVVQKLLSLFKLANFFLDFFGEARVVDGIAAARNGSSSSTC